MVVLDTETTGLSPFKGDRMVEIGAIEISNRSIKKDRTFHHYLNPERNIPEEVVRIHGIDNAKVANAPTFRDIAEEFLAYIKDATLIIHNAPFDLGFIMNELQLCGLPPIGDIQVIDTLEYARKRHPQQRNNLDALCDRYNISRGHRELHGALLDSELLADVYLAMTGGRQFSLGMDIQSKPASSFVQIHENTSYRDEKTETASIMRRPPVPIGQDEQNAHRAMLERIHQESENGAIWLEAATET